VQEKKNLQTTNLVEPASSFASTLTDSQKSQSPSMPSNAVSIEVRGPHDVDGKLGCIESNPVRGASIWKSHIVLNLCLG
jgi:hypothetical protein